MVKIELALFFCCVAAPLLLISTAASAWPFEEDDGRYLPDWKSLDTRPAPEWFDEAKVGIFVHWGVFSVPAFRSEWFWWDWLGAKDADVVDFMKRNYPPGWRYADFARSFRAEFFNATRWAQLFARSGARYVVLTSKHHEGYTLWPSATSFNWNSRDVGSGRDLVGELADAVRKTPVRMTQQQQQERISKTSVTTIKSKSGASSTSSQLRFGVYHSLFEWFNPLYLADKQRNFSTQSFVAGKTMPELFDLVERYRPDVIWSDGDWETTDAYWNATNFLAWLYNDSPVRDSVLVNDRWGRGTGGRHGDFFNFADRYNPGRLEAHKWENAMTLDRQSWGYRRNLRIEDVLTLDELVATLARTVSCNGNLLVNVGPRADGTIDAVLEERLVQLGDWLQRNGEAIYATRPWPTAQNDTLDGNVWYTMASAKSRSHSTRISAKTTTVYAIVLQKPSAQGVIRLGSLTSQNISANSRIVRLEDNAPLKFTADPKGLTIKVSVKTPAASSLPTSAFVIKIEFGSSF